MVGWLVAEVLGGGETTGEVATKMLDHHAKITNIFKEMYGDVRYGLTEVARDSAFLRSRPYLDLVERTMSQMAQWGGVGSATVTPAAGGGEAEGVVVAAKATSGFGGGGGGAVAKKKGGGAKKKKAKRK
eukprot:jgi/Undpi1/7962/HiC_scaffold_24.g10434.m1